MSPRQHTGGPLRRPDALRARSDSALIIFAKAPIPGQVKTRLCPPLTPDEAASLHGSVVLDMLERSRGLSSMDRFVACFPSPDHVFFKILEERHGVRLIAQTGEDLGARMASALADIFAQGYRRALVIGTDLPTLPGSLFGEALALLDTHDLVLGPAQDGGYYLIGLRKPAPELFVGIPWSTDRVLALTQTKASAAGLKTALLQVRRDIDTVEDLTALLEDLGGGAGAKLRGGELSPRTAGVLRLLADRLRTHPRRAQEIRKSAASL
ncbi:MAG: TIGR04282 family arsenosugar biosynthesis glycosyltransferase [Nitrospiraceae bacterium]